MKHTLPALLVFGHRKTVPEATLATAGAAAFAKLQPLPNLATGEIWPSCKWSEADLEALKATEPELGFHMVGGRPRNHEQTSLF